MKVILFCGGLGTRIREYSEALPKPMIPIGDRPILWHLMQSYSHYGCRDFVLCLGYKATSIKDFFLGYRPNIFNDCVVSTVGSKVEVIGDSKPDWRISLVDTGLWRNIGERLLAVREHVENEEFFFANYSDGLSDVDLTEMLTVFKKSKKVAAFMAVRPPLTFHLVDIDKESDRVLGFRSSDRADMWINAGFFIFRSQIFDYIREGEELVIEPFQRLVEANEIVAYKHAGFWRPMDTLRDRQVLEDMFEKGNTPWLPGTRKPNGVEAK
jgi:glucose-1-phosphate cytidylyltransferase